MRAASFSYLFLSNAGQYKATTDIALNNLPGLGRSGDGVAVVFGGLAGGFFEVFSEEGLGGEV